MTTSDKDATKDNREDVIPYQRVTTVGITERGKGERKQSTADQEEFYAQSQLSGKSP